MTNKEAIKIITSDFEMAVIPGEHLEAYNMAIKALRRVDCVYVKDECFAACGESGTCEAEEEGETDDD